MTQSPPAPARNRAHPFVERVAGKLLSEAPSAYLGSDDIVEVQHPAVQALTTHLTSHCSTDVGYARVAHAWVRDNIRHSFDVQDRRVTIGAAQTLHEGVGLCFSKAHLLTALLRARRIPPPDSATSA